MSINKYQRLVQGGVSLLTIASLVMLSLPAQAAKEIYQFAIPKPIVTQDGSRSTGDYLSIQYGIRDLANSVGNAYLEFLRVATDGSSVPFNPAVNTSALQVSNNNWQTDVSAMRKIDPDVLFGANTVYQVTLKDFGTAGYSSSTIPAKASSPLWVTIFGAIKITNFDLDASNGSSPIIIKQNGDPATGDSLKVTKTLAGTASSTLLNSGKAIELASGATATVDADLLTPGTQTIKLNAYNKIGSREKDVASTNSFKVTVLAQPKVSKQSVTDSTATQTGTKPSSCLAAVTNIGGDDKAVVKFDAANLTKMTLVLTGGDGVDHSFNVASPNGAGKLVAIQADCLAKGSYTAKINFENTSNFQSSATLTNITVN